MTARDPTLQRAVDEEVRRLATAAAATTVLADPLAWARDHVEGMYERGWRPWPRLDAIPQYGAGAPPTDDYLREAHKIRGDHR